MEGAMTAMSPIMADDDETAKRTWEAMHKFANNESLTEREREALSWLTLIDRSRLEFAPGNCRWATTEAERADNLTFYRSLGIQ
jgi:hypothetical protein